MYGRHFVTPCGVIVDLAWKPYSTPLLNQSHASEISTEDEELRLIIMEDGCCWSASMDDDTTSDSLGRSSVNTHILLAHCKVTAFQ